MASRCRSRSATPGTVKSGQLHRDLTEQRRDRVIPVILHVANTTANAGNLAARPPGPSPVRQRSPAAHSPTAVLPPTGQSRLAISARPSGLLISMRSVPGSSPPRRFSTNLGIHARPHPRSQYRRENIELAQATPVSRWSRVRLRPSLHLSWNRTTPGRWNLLSTRAAFPRNAMANAL